MSGIFGFFNSLSNKGKAAVITAAVLAEAAPAITFRCLQVFANRDVYQPLGLDGYKSIIADTAAPILTLLVFIGYGIKRHLDQRNLNAYGIVINSNDTLKARGVSGHVQERPTSAAGGRYGADPDMIVPSVRPI